jgi:hypothetical protein
MGKKNKIKKKKQVIKLTYCTWANQQIYVVIKKGDVA